MGTYSTGTDEAISAALSGKPTLIVGEAGTGKSHVINSLMQFLSYDTLLCAPTGVAAKNIGGTIMHSTFGLPIGFDTELPKLNSKKAKVLKSEHLSRIVIDEISMCRADMLSLTDKRLRVVRKTNEPFGGLCPIFVGDPLQLSPILQRATPEAAAFYKHYNNVNFFGSSVWRDLDFNVVELLDIHRQSDKEFVNVLSNIRQGVDIRNAIEYINDNCSRVKNEKAVILASTKKMVSEYNSKEFNNLSGKAVVYKTKFSGQTKELQIDPEVSLKVGARVMITANSPMGAYINGSMGTVKSLKSDKVYVDLDNGETVEVLEAYASNYAYESNEHGFVEKKEVGSARYLPIMLGYSMTINKSQGISLEDMSIDLGWGAFCSGQTYVALSRAKNISKLHLKSPLKEKDIITDKSVVEWLKRLRGGCV